MGIWVYQDTHTRPPKEEAQRDDCLFCAERLQELWGEGHRNLHASLRVCPSCGWWCKFRTEVSQGRGGEYFSLWGTCAQLKQLDIADITTPVDEVRQFLAAKYNDRFTMHPRLFEETVGSVFRSVGFDVDVTGYQGDGGIDVVLRDSSNCTIGVQVKRYRDKIQVEQIRAFAGALILNDHTRGIFITTSGFTAGSKIAAGVYGAKGLPIELVDAQKFFSALRLAQRSPYNDSAEWLEQYGDIMLPNIYEDDGPTYLFM